MGDNDEVLRTPGEVLGLVDEYDSGAGTHVRGGHVCASLMGVAKVTAAPPGSGDKKAKIEIVRNGKRSAIPQIGATVIVKVTKVNPRLVVTDILCVGSIAVSEKFSGIIRQQDVRATETDKVDMSSCFRPGDLVRAEVLSLGTARAYYLTTAKNELGVVAARCFAGAPMVPISWQEMQCPVTKQKEFRKVAKV